jgi:hypothetical protein
MHRVICFLLCLSLITNFAISQTNPVIDIFPKGTTLHGNIAYNKDTLNKHLLDIYLPPNAKGQSTTGHLRAWRWLVRQ